MGKGYQDDWTGVFAPLLHSCSTVIIVQQEVCRLGQLLAHKSSIIVVWVSFQDNCVILVNDPLERISGIASWVTDIHGYFALAPIWDIGGLEDKIQGLM